MPRSELKEMLLSIGKEFGLQASLVLFSLTAHYLGNQGVSGSTLMCTC